MDNNTTEQGVVIPQKTIEEASTEVDGELQLVINNEVDGAILESTQEVQKRFKVALSQELTTRLYDRANQVGRAFIIKKVLKKKSKIYDLQLKLAQGGTYIDETTIFNADGTVKCVVVRKKEIPPNYQSVKWLLSKIDGSSSTGKVTQKRTTKRSIDDVVNDTTSPEEEAS